MLVPWGILCQNNEESNCLLENLIEVAAADPLIFDEIVQGILQSDPCIKSQAADMVEKVTRVRPLFLTPYKRILLKEFSEMSQWEVRAKVAMLYGRVFWDEWEMQQVVTLLGRWIDTEEEETIIINSLQSLYTLALQKVWIRPGFLQYFKNAVKHTSLRVRAFAESLEVSLFQV